mmetsp:Transcript_9668/g.16254  ORF Transcript_9668/g.16254 Transcript_9668/m.16254 type:complete len:129 (-) Transcript_9668:64-450(-)
MEVQGFEQSVLNGKRKPFCLVDTRAPQDYAKGHILGALNLHSQEFFTETEEGHLVLKPKSERLKILQEADILPAEFQNNEIVAYGLTGLIAPRFLGAISEIAGDINIDHLSLYDGSWLEYLKLNKAGL